MSCSPHFGTAAGIGKEMGAGSVSTTAPNVAGNSGSGFEVISLGRILGNPDDWDDLEWTQVDTICLTRSGSSIPTALKSLF